MEVTYTHKQNTLYIILSGELDDYSAAAARHQVDKLIDEHCSADQVIFNLASVRFMDSTGIGFLIGRYKKCKRLSMPLFLQSPNPAADKILSLSGLYSLIPKL